MKAGGTARGIKDLLNEFDSELIGIGVLINHIGIEEKMVNDYYSIVELKDVDEKGVVDLKPSKFIEAEIN